MTNDAKGTVRQAVFAELLRIGVPREEFARETINVARECYASLCLVPRFRKEAGELAIDIVEGDASQPFDEALIEMNETEILTEIGYEAPKHNAP